MGVTVTVALTGTLNATTVPAIAFRVMVLAVGPYTLTIWAEPAENVPVLRLGVLMTKGFAFLAATVTVRAEAASTSTAVVIVALRVTADERGANTMRAVEVPVCNTTGARELMYAYDTCGVARFRVSKTGALTRRHVELCAVIVRVAAFTASIVRLLASVGWDRVIRIHMWSLS